MGLFSDFGPQGLFPKIEPTEHGMLEVGDGHMVYWEVCGNPKGKPALVLHGGPGAGGTTDARRFFNPRAYRIVLFDQRGAGRSTPLGEVRENTTPLLVSDIERLRELLGVERWLVFGGSWGSTLALAYGQAHPERCTGFVLRGIFLCTQGEIDWFMHGMRWFFPQAHADFVAPIPVAERADLLNAYARRLFSDDAAQNASAARAWARYEGRCVPLLPHPETVDEFAADSVSLALGRLEAHYFVHRGFFAEDQLLLGMPRISHLPAVIVQGRYDVVCPAATACALHEAWSGSRLHIVEDAGHASTEPGTCAALVAATEQFRTQRSFS